jgi:hypothetical protein
MVHTAPTLCSALVMLVQKHINGNMKSHRCMLSAVCSLPQAAAAAVEAAQLYSAMAIESVSYARPLHQLSLQSNATWHVRVHTARLLLSLHCSCNGPTLYKLAEFAHGRASGLRPADDTLRCDRLCKGKHHRWATVSSTSGVSKIRICVLCGCRPVCADMLLSPAHDAAHVFLGDANTDHGHSFNHNTTQISQANSFLPVRYCNLGMGPAQTAAAPMHALNMTAAHVMLHASVYVTFGMIWSLHRPLHSVSLVRL